MLAESDKRAIRLAKCTTSFVSSYPTDYIPVHV